MILVDTSVLVDYLRSPSDRALRLFEENEAAICGTIRAEILAGARKPSDINRIANSLEVLKYIDISKDTWDHLGKNLSSLRAAGVTVPFPDALIATVAIENDIQLWTNDLHFVQIARVLPTLRLFRSTAQ